MYSKTSPIAVARARRPKKAQRRAREDEPEGRKARETTERGPGNRAVKQKEEHAGRTEARGGRGSGWAARGRR